MGDIIHFDVRCVAYWFKLWGLDLDLNSNPISPLTSDMTLDKYLLYLQHGDGTLYFTGWSLILNEVVHMTCLVSSKSLYMKAAACLCYYYDHHYQNFSQRNKSLLMKFQLSLTWAKGSVCKSGEYFCWCLWNSVCGCLFFFWASFNVLFPSADLAMVVSLCYPHLPLLRPLSSLVPKETNKH